MRENLNWTMEISRAHFDVVRRREVFGEVISSIKSPSLPNDPKLLLSDAILNPMKTHVHSFGMLLLDGVLCNTQGGRIICVNGCGRLLVAHICKGVTDGGGSFSIEK